MDNKKKWFFGKKIEKKHFRLSVWITLLIVVTVILTTGGVLAKYIGSNQKRVEMESSQFHISSNYLTEGENTAYSVTDWDGGFDILLYNYEKENVAQISEVKITYTVTVDNATVSVKNQNGEALSANADGYSFGDEVKTAVYHTLHVTPDSAAKQGDRIAVTVRTTSPYQKTLTAKFTLQSNNKPDYTITDRGDGTVLVTVKTNDYQSTMTVKWNPDKLSPDNTNALMASWTNETPQETFRVNRNSTYELLFFKNANNNNSYTTYTGSGTEITLN